MYSEINHSHFIDFYSNELENNSDVLLKLCFVFYSQVEEFIALENQLQNKKKTIKEVAHKLKSSCHSFGFMDLAKLLQEIENSENDIDYTSQCRKSFGKAKCAQSELQYIVEKELNIKAKKES